MSNASDKMVAERMTMAWHAFHKIEPFVLRVNRTRD